MAVTEEELDALMESKAKAAEDADEDYEGGYDDCTEELATANDLLKKTGVLLEFISDPDLCKSITKRERTIINTHLGRIYDCIDQLNQLEGLVEAENEE